MEVHCGSCPAKYAIPDDKVRGRKVRIKCKHCSAPIVVDGTALGGSPSGAPKAASAPPAATQPRAAQPAAAVQPKPAVASPAAKPAPQPAPTAAVARPAQQPAVQHAAPAAKSSPAAAPAPSASPLRLGGAAATATARAVAPAAAPEPAIDSSASWREPAQEAAPASRQNPHAAWREPAAATRGIKSTMLGIPAPATMPARPQKATLLGLEAPLPPVAPPVAPAPAPIPAAPAAASTFDAFPEPRGGRSVKRTMLGIPAPAGELPLRPEAPKPAPEAPRIATPVPAPPYEQAARFDQTAEPEWTVAVTDDDHREMTTAEVLEAYSSGRIGDDTFIWAEGMDDWKNPFDIPLIAAELGARGFAPGAGGFDDDKTVIAEAPSESKPSGVWREPGSWRPPGGEEGESDVSFDDVTVSMDSNKAAELLRAAGAMDEAARGSDALDELMDDAAHDDVTLAVDSRPFFAEGRPLSDMIAGARALEARHEPTDGGWRPDQHGADWDDEPTTAMEGLPPPSDDQRPTGARNEDSVLFSLDALAQSESSPDRADQVDDDILLAPSAPMAPAPEPRAAVPAAFAATMPAGGFAMPPQPPPAMAPASALVPAPELRPAVHQAVPGPLPAPAPKRGTSWAWLWVLLFFMLAAAAAAAAFYFRQPAKLFEMLGLPP